MKNFIKNLKNIKIGYFKIQILSLLLMIVIILSSVFFSIFNNYKRESNILIASQKLDYQRKNAFKNNIRKISALLALQVESSLKYSDIKWPNKKKFIFDLQNHRNLKDQTDPLDLTVLEGLEIQRLRSWEYVKKSKLLSNLKTVLNFLKESPDLIKIIDDGMFRNFYEMLITSSEISSTFINSLEEIFREILPPKNQQLTYTITDTIKSFRWTDRLIDLIETAFYKTDIPLNVKQKKIYRLLKFMEILNKFFDDKKPEYIDDLKKRNMWERFEGSAGDENKLLPDTSKTIKILKSDTPDDFEVLNYSDEKSDEESSLFNQLKTDGSFVNRYPKLVYKTLKKKLFKNAAKLFLGFIGPLAKEFLELVSNLTATKDKLLLLSDSKFQSISYIFKILVFLSKNEVPDTSVNEKVNLKRFLESFVLELFEILNSDGEEVGFFKEELIKLFEAEKKLENISPLKNNLILGLLENFGNSVLTDKSLNNFFLLLAKQIENNTKFYAKYFEEIDIYSPKLKNIFKSFKKQMNNSDNGMNEQLDDIEELTKEIREFKTEITDTQIDDYLDKFKKLFEKIIDLVIYIVNSILNDESKDSISLRVVLNVLNIFLQQFNIISENLGYNVLSPIFETIFSLGEDKKLLIDTLEFIKYIGTEVLINKLLKVRLLYKNKADWNNQKLSYCYIKSLIRNKFDPQKDCKVKEIDIEKPDYFSDINSDTEYKKGSPIEKGSPLAKIIDLIQNENQEENTFETFRKLLAKIFSFSSNVLEKINTFVKNEYYNNFGFYYDERNWEFNDNDKKWFKYNKALEESKNEYYKYDIIGTLKRNRRIIYSYRFVYEINLKKSILKIIELEKLI